ncbi:MAG: hypothetical protein FJX76_09435 [Armatimonadetes bacterium]|nr:hypothetical protein [Armatimonadota bacterium]
MLSITANPHAAPTVGRAVRSKRVKRFPYSLLHSVENDGVVIVAVAHHRRRPGYWSARLQDR